MARSIPSTFSPTWRSSHSGSIGAAPTGAVWSFAGCSSRPWSPSPSPKLTSLTVTSGEETPYLGGGGAKALPPLGVLVPFTTVSRQQPARCREQCAVAARVDGALHLATQGALAD